MHMRCIVELNEHGRSKVLEFARAVGIGTRKMNGVQILLMADQGGRNGEIAQAPLKNTSTIHRTKKRQVGGQR